MNVKSDLYAKVKSFNQYGRLRIEFSEVMNTTLGFKGLNSSISFLHQNESKDLNQSANVNLMEIYVKPSLERDLDDEFFEMQ